jgi:uncharacterized ion transporter superfamily protein YfcC
MENTTKLLIQIIAFTFSAIIAFTLPYLLKLKQDKELSDKAGEKIARAEAIVKEEPAKAKPAWDLARATLEAYFNRNLSQISSIFWLCLVVMAAGFGIIIWGITQSILYPNVLAPAVLASLSGIIIEFIGATFLFIYRSTIQQAINYSRTLERINSVGMAMQILDTMPDETKSEDLKSQTKAKLVQLLVQQAYDPPNKQTTNKATKSAGDSE